MLRRLAFLLLIAVCAMAQTTLWKVTHEGKVLYIGGTVHMLRPADYPLPTVFDKAFALADILVFETDIAGMNTPETARMMRERLMYASGASLRDDLRRSTYLDLKKYAAENQLSMAMLDAMKPPLVVMTIMNLELQRLGMTAPGVDQHYFAQASGTGKKIRWFETVREQIDMLSCFGQEDADDMVLESLAETQEYETVMGQILSAWREGSTEQLMRIGRKYLMSENEADYRRLIVARNRQWMRQLEPMLKSRETELVLVGALHLVGPDGLIAQLKRRGYRVEQL